MEGGSASSPVTQYWQQYSMLFQHYLDKSTPHAAYRWIGTAILASIYILRVFYLQGFYIVSYGLGIYLLNLLIGFLSPLVDPQLEPSDSAVLPTKGSDEFKPFIRRLPEFKFWLVISTLFVSSILCYSFIFLCIWPVNYVTWLWAFIICSLVVQLSWTERGRYLVNW